MRFFLLLVVIGAVFLWLAPKLLSGIGYLVSPPYVFVDKLMAAKGKVQLYSVNRQKHLYLIEGRPETFDFDGFHNAELWEGSQLGHYLKGGDLVQKRAHSDTLRVIRNGKQSIWMLAPEAR